MCLHVELSTAILSIATLFYSSLVICFVLWRWHCSWCLAFSSISKIFNCSCWFGNAKWSMGLLSSHLFVVSWHLTSPSLVVFCWYWGGLHCEMTREQNKNDKVWFGKLRIKENESWYKEKYRKLEGQLTNSINDDDMMTKVIRELIAIKRKIEVTSEQVLAWSRRVEAQWSKNHKQATKEGKEFNTMKNKREKNNAFNGAMAARKETHSKCKYWRSTHEPHWCPAYCMSCSGCSKLNLFKWVCRG